MSELPLIYEENLRIPELATYKSINGVISEWIKHPTGGDQLLSFFAEAWLIRIHGDQEVQNAIEEMIDHHNRLYKKPEDPLLDADTAANLIRVGAQHEFLKLDKLCRKGLLDEEFHYPDPSLSSVEGMGKGISRILVGGPDFIHHLAWERNEANVADRYKAIKIGLHYFEHVLGAGPYSGLDVGCSIGNGDKKLLSPDPSLASFRPIRAMVQDHPGSELREEEYLSSHFNSIIAQPKNITEIVGFDIKASMTHLEWIRSCSFRFAEMGDPARTTEFNRLVEANLPSFMLHHGDFTNIQDVEKFKRDYGYDKKFDYVSMFTVASQWSESEIETGLHNGASLLKENGILFIQDKFIPDFTNKRTGIKVAGHWNDPWVYRMSVIIPTSEWGMQPVEFLRWKTGRCLDMWFDPPGRKDIKTLAPYF